METKYTQYMEWVKAGEALGLSNHRLQGHDHFEFRDKDGYVFGRWSENLGHLDPDARKNQLEREAAQAKVNRQFQPGIRTETYGPSYTPLAEQEYRHGAPEPYVAPVGASTGQPEVLSSVRTEPLAPLPPAALGPGVPVKGNAPAGLPPAGKGGYRNKAGQWVPNE